MPAARKLFVLVRCPPRRAEMRPAAPLPAARGGPASTSGSVPALAPPRFVRAPRPRGSPPRRAARTPRATARGGDAFDRLVRAQPPELLASTHASARLEALDAFWRARGVRERAYRERLLAHATEDDGREDELYGDPARLAVALDRLQSYFPRAVDVAAMCWKAPGILRLPPKHVAAQLVSLRWALPDLDVPKIVEAQPGLLLRDVGVCAEAVALLRREFPLVDAVAVVETEPGVLAEECDVRARIERLREARANGRLSPSAEMFYDGEGLGCANPALFAKVFLEESRSKAEAYECDQRCG